MEVATSADVGGSTGVESFLQELKVIEAAVATIKTYDKVFMNAYTSIRSFSFRGNGMFLIKNAL